MAATDELVAEDDRRIAFRLKRPFPLLFDALAKPSSPCCFIMPERIASTDAGTPIRDIVGSDRSAGSRTSACPAAAWFTREPGLRPRESGSRSGPRVRSG
jgi:peptide/nickel transport system substrate-binding protein